MPESVVHVLTGETTIGVCFNNAIERLLPEHFGHRVADDLISALTKGLQVRFVNRLVGVITVDKRHKVAVGRNDVLVSAQCLSHLLAFAVTLGNSQRWHGGIHQLRHCAVINALSVITKALIPAMCAAQTARRVIN